MHLLVFLLLHSSNLSASTQDDPQELIDNGGYMVQGAIGDLQFRAQEPFIPASTLKILTALLALESLGEDFRFETHFFLDEDSNLYIKGYGDPFLTSEAVLQIGYELTNLGVGRIHSLFLDDTSYLLEGQVADHPSSNPYDAPNGALAVNFNALPLFKAKDGTISSGEPQTPLLPMMKRYGKELSPGSYRLNVSPDPGPRRLNASLQYTGELFVNVFGKAGIIVERGFRGRKVPSGLSPLYIHFGTLTLTEIVRACLKYSNNFIANQLFLAVGVSHLGLPATWEKSRRAMAHFTQKFLSPDLHQLQVVEGSGLSRDNRVSAATLVKILSRFRKYSDLLPAEHKILLKTGTLEDVFCYAGYFPDNDTLVPFAILLNQKRNTRDNLVTLLHRMWQREEQIK
ncbi:MAG: D-alanyl-D-alanine carboxypeptidase/D-alanyl-D-alanine-endopeptidase [Desulforhopalus sp.]